MNASEAWVQPGRDSLHLHWSHVGYSGAFYHTPDGDPLWEFAALAKQARVTAVSISNELVFPVPFGDMDRRTHGSMAPRWEHIPAIEGGSREYRVVIKMVNIHVSFPNARRSGLFGLLGDAPVQLVDYFDLQTIRAFHDLFLSHGEPDRDQEALDAFEEMLDFPASSPHPSSSSLSSNYHEDHDHQSEGKNSMRMRRRTEIAERFAAKVMDWQSQFRDNWLVHKLGRERQTGGSSSPPPDNCEIWIPVGPSIHPQNSSTSSSGSSSAMLPTFPGGPGGPGHALRWFLPTGGTDRNDFLLHHRLNRENQWVRRALDEMPAFRPAIMFRLCTRRCYASKPPRPRPVRGRGRGSGAGGGRGVH